MRRGKTLISLALVLVMAVTLLSAGAYATIPGADDPC